MHKIDTHSPLFKKQNAMKTKWEGKAGRNGEGATREFNNVVLNTQISVISRSISEILEKIISTTGGALRLTGCAR